MINSALAYAKKGWHIFPCQPGLKIPFPGTNGCLEASNDEDMIRAWWTRWPNANIALACGEKSGVYVIDIDMHKSDSSGFDSVSDLGDLRTLTLAQITPRKGLHALFKCDGEPPRNKNNFKAGVDIRSDGYYIMLTPSTFRGHGTYTWIDENMPLAEFPEAYKPKKSDNGLKPWERPAPTKTARPRISSTNDVINRAIAYLAECPCAVQGSGGHDALLWATRAMVWGFDLDDATALKLLWTHYNPRCCPPWNQNSASEVKDFERKVREVRKTPSNKPVGWLRDQQGTLRYDDDEDILLEMGANIVASLLGHEKTDKKTHTSVVITQDENEYEEEEEHQPAQKWPESILHPPGLVGEMCDWINSSAGCYQPILTLGASLVACGALFGRKVRDESNGRTNIYAMGVAHSSAGKDHPSDCIERLFHSAGASKILGGQVTSDSAIEVSLMEHMTKLYCWDEIGHIFANIKQAGGSGGNAHLRTIVPTLMQLYSSPHKLYVGKQRADGEARRLDQPHVCIWGLTSPDVLYGSISKAELRDGWLGRVLTFISQDRPKYKIVKDSPPPDALASMVQAWFSRTIQGDGSKGDIIGATSCNQIVVPTTSEAYAVFEAFRDEAYELMLAADKAGDDCQFLWGKALQNARRIALTVGVGRRWDGAEIEKSDAAYGCALIRCAIQNFSEAIEKNISDSQWESDKQRLLKLIDSSGPGGIAKSELTRRTQWVKDGKTRDSYLSDMQDGGMIIFGTNPNNPKSRQGWLWTRKHGRKAMLKRQIKEKE